MCELKKIKGALDLSIARLVANKENFVKDGKKDFIHSSKLTFEKMIRILLQAGGQSLHKELSSYFNFDISMPTPSANSHYFNLLSLAVFAITMSFIFFFKGFSGSILTQIFLS